MKIDPAYVEEKSENSLQEVNKISTSITEVNCALDRLIEKYNFSDFKSLNRLKIGEEINSHTEMLDTAKNIVKKIEKLKRIRLQKTAKTRYFQKIELSALFLER